jgi:hypothetical protein
MLIFRFFIIFRQHQHSVNVIDDGLAALNL